MPKNLVAEVSLFLLLAILIIGKFTFLLTATNLLAITSESSSPQRQVDACAAELCNKRASSSPQIHGGACAAELCNKRPSSSPQRQVGACTAELCNKRASSSPQRQVGACAAELYNKRASSLKCLHINYTHLGMHKSELTNMRDKISFMEVEEFPQVWNIIKINVTTEQN